MQTHSVTSILDEVRDPELYIYMEKYISLVEMLQQTTGETHETTAERLCRLSSTIRFQLGPRNFAPQQFRERLAAFLRWGADAIDPTQGGKYSRIAKEHIHQHADLMADPVTRDV